MKKFTKITAIVALMLVVCLSFAGCDNLGKTILSALSLDVTVNDPALVKVEDILDKKVKTESVKNGSFVYTLYTDNTACVTDYTGNDSVVSIPAESVSRTSLSRAAARSRSLLSPTPLR